jgi:hypothetical protein
MRGVSYGDCVCGHSRKDHLDKKKDTRLHLMGKSGRTLERNAARNQQTLSEAPAADRKRQKPCRVYRLDVAAEDGECVCGHSRSAHARQGVYLCMRLSISSSLYLYTCGSTYVDSFIDACVPMFGGYAMSSKESTHVLPCLI